MDGGKCGGGGSTIEKSKILPVWCGACICGSAIDKSEGQACVGFVVIAYHLPVGGGSVGGCGTTLVL